MKDKLGQRIKPGDIILYIARHVGDQELAFAKVLALSSTKFKYNMKPTPCVLVHAVDEYGGKAKLNQRKSNLTHNEEMIVVDRDKVPQKIIDLLDKVT